MTSKRDSKWVAGPGGVRCSCCRRHSYSMAKRLHRRYLRRKDRQEAKGEPVEGIS